ncbi:MAG TPA: hypothetical protein VF525_00265, partial [Pyrinomonadaceae bacterium]
MRMKRGIIGLFSMLMFCGALTVRAQEVTEDAVLRVRTRVVSLDALVKDKKTKAPVTDLKLENFEVLADGQPRQLSYFTREGDVGRKPLALALVFDLERLGAGRYLRRTEILAAMANELSKLPPADEVAVVVLDPGGVEGKREWLTKFTRSRAQIASALAIVPTLVGESNGGDIAIDNGGPVSQTADEQQKSNGTPPSAAEVKRTTEQSQPDAATTTEGAQKSDAAKKEDKPETEGEVVDVFQDKDGHTVRRIVKPDGHIIIERKDADGTVT